MITEIQKRFIWLAFAEKRSYSEIAKELNVNREQLSEWTEKLKDEWKPISEIKTIYGIKKIKKIDFDKFHDWYKEKDLNKKCEYCGITEKEIELLSKNKPLTKRPRGKKLELDRKKPELEYDELDNIVFACYWCNNAKTDTFTHQEFMEVGKSISNIWKERLKNAN